MHNFLVLTWRSHPARHQPLRLGVAVAALLAIGFLSLVATGSTLVSLAMVVVVWASVYEFFVATEYRIDERGVTERRPGLHRHRSWKSIRRVVRGRRGILLSPLVRPNRWLDSRRGTYLRYAGNGEVVRQLVDCYMAARNPEADR